MEKVLFQKDDDNRQHVLGVELNESKVEKIEYIKTKAIGLMDVPIEYEYIKLTITNSNNHILNKKVVIEVWDNKLFDLVMNCKIGEKLNITASPNIFSGKCYAAIPITIEKISLKAINIKKP